MTRDQARENVYVDIDAERCRQDKKWGPNRRLSGMLWVLIAGEEMGEVCRSLLQCQGDDDLYAEVTQAAAVLVAWLEQMERDGARDE